MKKRLIRDITKGYVFTDDKDLIATQMVCDALGNLLNTKRDYSNPEIRREFVLCFDIDRVIFNNPATIIYWKDGTKTVVKAENERFDPEKGLAMAIAKRALGNKGNYYNQFKKWIDSEDTD